jgi:hypothetical protein
MKTDRQYVSLKFIYNHLKNNAMYPSNQQMAEVLDIDTNRWGNTRRLLIRQNKLITSKIWDFELHPDVLQSFYEQEKISRQLVENPVQPQVVIPSAVPGKKQPVSVNKTIPSAKAQESDLPLAQFQLRFPFLVKLLLAQIVVQTI